MSRQKRRDGGKKGEQTFKMLRAAAESDLVGVRDVYLSAPRKVLNAERARARQVGGDASWEMKSICLPAACLPYVGG